jgi:hypothetical protein
MDKGGNLGLDGIGLKLWMMGVDIGGIGRPNVFIVDGGN